MLGLSLAKNRLLDICTISCLLCYEMLRVGRRWLAHRFKLYVLNPDSKYVFLEEANCR
jgi:hypothetical protein